MEKTPNIVESSVYAYKTVWDERRYLFGLIFVPILIKITCLTMVFYFAPETVIWQSLVMLPSFFAEGWFIAQFLRTFFKKEYWPRKFNENEQISPKTDERARGILSCVIAFVLTKMFISVLSAIVIEAKLVDIPPMETADPEKEFLSALPAIGFLFFLFWAFRFFWLYIPLSVNMPLMRFLAHIKGLKASMNMLGIWLFCIIPVLLIMMMMNGVLLDPYGGDPNAAPPFISFLAIALNVIFGMLMDLLSVAGMATLFYTLFTGRIIDFGENDT